MFGANCCPDLPTGSTKRNGVLGYQSVSANLRQSVCKPYFLTKRPSHRKEKQSQSSDALAQNDKAMPEISELENRFLRVISASLLAGAGTTSNNPGPTLFAKLFARRTLRGFRWWKKSCGRKAFRSWLVILICVRTPRYNRRVKGKLHESYPQLLDAFDRQKNAAFDEFITSAFGSASRLIFFDFSIKRYLC